MKSYKITVNGNTYDVTVEEAGTAAAAPAATAAPREAAPAAPAPASGSTQVKSPMPGNIIDIKVNAGDKVSKGQTLIILEAMKMENDIPAPVDGVVDAVLVNKGDAVEVDAALVSIK